MMEGARFRGWLALTLRHTNRLYGWLLGVAQAPHTQHAATTTTPGSKLTACRGTRAQWDYPPMGLFHHHRRRASLAWEWEETRFRGWRALTLRHTTRLYG